ncbi:zinc finger and SCAN domain-containing protein 21-like isoform X2 [Conger conger]|nr:zinc finger and SCAN domain-containing protein 21-like isoform X2 [Conger conger]XP_061086788.1 zinc finger and SCAN domain-containing protein 21-like isoform X2 [Conger conger]
MSEYQQETTRIKRENESLKWKLREVGLEAETTWETDAQLAALPVMRGRSLIERQHCEQEWSSSLRQDTELTLTEEKEEITEGHRIRQREEEPVCSRITKSRDCSESCTPELNTEAHESATYTEAHESATYTAPSVKNDYGQESINPSHLFRIQVVNTEEVDSVPNMVSSKIKAEPNGVDYVVAEKLTDSESFSKLNSDSMNNGSGLESWSASQSEAQEAEEMQEAFDGQRSYGCPECGKSFSHACQLKLHRRIHTGEKPYCCIECGKCFNHAGHFKVHQRIHTGEKPYSCLQCGKSFKQIGHLNVHVRIHTGEKPYVCTVCGKGFIESGTLKIHCRTHTGERPYCCSLCGKTYNRRTHLNHHLRTHSRLKNMQHDNHN